MSVPTDCGVGGSLQCLHLQHPDGPLIVDAGLI
jgi:hypothetical protein